MAGKYNIRLHLFWSC